MTRRQLIGAVMIAPGLFVSTVSTSIFAKPAAAQSLGSCTFLSSSPLTAAVPVGQWDSPVEFRFITRHDHARGLQLEAVSFYATYHGKEYSEMVPLVEHYTLQDIVDATQLLQGLADDTLNYLIQGQL